MKVANRFLFFSFCLFIFSLIYADHVTASGDKGKKRASDGDLSIRHAQREYEEARHLVERISVTSGDYGMWRGMASGTTYVMMQAGQTFTPVFLKKEIEKILLKMLLQQSRGPQRLLSWKNPTNTSQAICQYRPQIPYYVYQKSFWDLLKVVVETFKKKRK